MTKFWILSPQKTFGILSFNRLWLRYTNHFCGKIFFEGLVWGSVNILPLNEIKFFLDVVNHYGINFHLKKIKSHYYDILEGYRATLSGAKSKMNITLNGWCDVYILGLRFGSDPYPMNDINSVEYSLYLYSISWGVAFPTTCWSQLNITTSNVRFIDYAKVVETRCCRRVNNVTTDVASCPPDYEALSQRNLKRKRGGEAA
jgi:hypothetical protein